MLSGAIYKVVEVPVYVEFIKYSGSFIKEIKMLKFNLNWGDEMKRPLGVSLISYFYIFGIVVLIVTAMFYDADSNKFGMADRFGLPNFPEQLFRIVLAVVSLIIIYGYMRLKRWGF